jgi:signal transduction histidine kinase/HAMP domain-containing protein
MFSLRTKLSLGFGSLLVIVAVIGVMIFAQLNQLGDAIDVILRENYRSVVACQNMKEALERIDSGLLMAMSGNPALGDSLIDHNLVVFQEALTVEKHNVTLPGELGLVSTLVNRSDQYFAVLKAVRHPGITPEERRDLYFAQVFPLFLESKNTAQKILDLNQSNMTQANNLARHEAATARDRMVFALLGCIVIALGFSLSTQYWVLRPIRRLNESIREVETGNLELVLHTGSKDEIGQLAVAFNGMTLALRERRRSDNLTLVRTRRATEEVIHALPSAIAVTDIQGYVEIATDSARKLFGLKPGEYVRELELPWLQELYHKATSTGFTVEWPDEKGYIQAFADFREFFFQPVVIPLPVPGESGVISGTVILFRDMTQVHEQQELKRSVVSTVSHQLKTPLTSLRMSLHLLQDNRLGTLSEKQVELVLAAREETERLTTIINDLLDIHRLNENRTLLDLKPIDPAILLQEAVSPFILEARDKGIDLRLEIAERLPRVMVDSSRFSHVFANLISNALNYTQPGGIIVVSARTEQGRVRFAVKDTGQGIAPEHQKHLFEQFYRVPGSSTPNGVGLGLAITREIVQAHHGEISVESEPGHGSTFYVDLKPTDSSPLPIVLTGGFK